MHDDLLRAALDGLGLAPGAGWSEVLARYRQLAKVSHPDRFKSNNDKTHAEEKLKKIIAAKELLQEHYFSDKHRSRGWCICWGRASQPPITTETVRAPQATPTQATQSPAPQPPPTQPPPPQPPPPQPPPKNEERKPPPSPPPSQPPPPRQPPPQPPKQPPPPPPPSQPPPNPQKEPDPKPDKDGDSKQPETSHENTSGWDWRNEFCQYLDIGPLTEGEPPWLETFRRTCEKITGKHPGETIEDIWTKAPVTTKEHKRKCLLLVLFAVMAIDKVLTAIDPDAFKSPAQLAQPQNSKPYKPSLPLSPFPDIPKPNFGPPVEFDSPDEIHKEQQYFEKKWQEKEEMLRRIRPGYQPNP